ncbi:MAG: hypothetical protein QM621_08665 [Aeromicrobium sp.]|uniref:hypothetical protein n=1 Tax=Aeromicrobium sp. TaxID=1871063 RepID=UPI0039E2C843
MSGCVAVVAQAHPIVVVADACATATVGVTAQVVDVAADADHAQITVDPPPTVEVAPRPVEVAVDVSQRGAPGPPGPPGPPGDGQRLLAPAAVTAPLSGHALVVIDDGRARPVDVSDPADADRPLHLTLGALDPGDGHTVLALGTVVEETWAWPHPARLYASAAGRLTADPPAGAAWSRVVALTRSPTSIHFNPQPPIHTD